MSNIFQKVASFTTKVFHALIGEVQKVDGVIDKDAPIVEALLNEGASVAKTIPGIGPQAAEILDAGVALIGQVKDAADATDAAVVALQAEVNKQAPLGMSFLLIENDVKAAVEAVIAKYEQEFQTAKTAVTAALPKASK